MNLTPKVTKTIDFEYRVSGNQFFLIFNNIINIVVFFGQYWKQKSLKKICKSDLSCHIFASAFRKSSISTDCKSFFF
jgi:hypothetical protein